MADIDYEREVQQAAGRGDAEGMLVALASSGILENLADHIVNQYDVLNADDAKDVVADSVDALFARIGGGERKRDVLPYFYKIAQNKAKDRAKQGRAHDSFDEAKHDVVREEYDDDYLADRESWRARQFAEVKRLIGQMEMSRPRQVIGFIFDALEKGGFHLTNAEVGKALGISATAAAMAKSRGFDSLIELGKSQGVIDIGFTLRDIKSADDADALDNDEESNGKDR